LPIFLTMAFPSVSTPETPTGPMRLTDLDENRNVVKQAPDLNSPAYALIQALQHHHRESSYIDSILANPDSLNCAYNPLGTTVKQNNKDFFFIFS